jgi:hypothetical protein
MVKCKCRNCGTGFEAESLYTGWRSGEHIELKCPNGKGHAVRWIEYGDRGYKRR